MLFSGAEQWRAVPPMRWIGGSWQCANKGTKREPVGPFICRLVESEKTVNADDALQRRAAMVALLPKGSTPGSRALRIARTAIHVAHTFGALFGAHTLIVPHAAKECGEQVLGGQPTVEVTPHRAGLVVPWAILEPAIDDVLAERGPRRILPTGHEFVTAGGLYTFGVCASTVRGT